MNDNDFDALLEEYVSMRIISSEMYKVALWNRGKEANTIQASALQFQQMGDDLKARLKELANVENAKRTKRSFENP